MEVLVTEEKKKIFRARKTMKISDRQQLDSLHSTLLTAAPALPSPSPPPLMNGTHKEDGQKAGDKDQNVSDSNSPQAQSPTSAASLNSPAPFLSLNLSPSSVSSQSPVTLEETTPPTSPGNTVSNDLKSMEEEDKSRSSSNESVTPASTESKEKDTEGALVEEPKQKPIILEDPSVELTKDSTKGSASCSPTPPPVSDYTEPMDTDSDATKAADPEPSTAETQEKKPSSPNLTTSDFPSSSCSSSSNSASSSSADRKQKNKNQCG